MEQQPDISVITVNYNGFEDTCEFIDSWVSAVTSVSYEIIVVDNASRNDDGRRLQQRYPAVTVICSGKNLGFAGANNLGISAARGKHLFFLNNDVVMTAGSLRPLLDRLESERRIAGVTPLIRDYEAPHAIQFAGYTPLSTVTLRNRTLGEGATDKEDYPARPTPYLHGAAMLMKRSAIDKVGLLPEEFFLYYEELDWCTLFTLEGYELWYDPAYELYHKASKSTGQHSPLKAFYLSRNRLLYAYRNRFGFSLWAAFAYQLAVVLPKTVLVSLFQGRKDIAQAHWKGVKAFFELRKKYIPS